MKLEKNYSKTRIYKIYVSMKNRCERKTSINYERYGGRGIKVCKWWQKFENFYKWAIKNGYNNDLSLDRINNNKGYTPKNCRWVDRKTQQRNTRANVVIELNVERHCIAEWAEITGINHSTIRSRYSRKWKAEDILTKKRRKLCQI